jgi:glycosyltransferase involved in cell wall biosynthesis
MNNEHEHPASITVLMAVYNGERWLEDSIPSVLRQTFTNFEFIIINDGSDDRSLQIINRFADKDSRIRVYSKKNSGLTESLNYGIKKAEGEWLARIDADDICKKDRLEKQIKCVRENTNVVLVGTGLKIIDGNVNQSKVHLYPESHNRLKRRLVRGSPFFAHSSAFFRLSAVRELGGYRTQFHRSQDQDLWLRLAEVGRITCIQEALVLIRKHDQQISHVKSGPLQSVYSHMAMTSSILRSKGLADPMETSLGEKAATFHDFILQKLEDDKHFEYQKIIYDLKEKIYKANTGVAKFRIAARIGLLRPNLFYRYVKFRLFGSYLPIKCAHEWIRLEQNDDKF